MKRIFVFIIAAMFCSHIGQAKDDVSFSFGGNLNYIKKGESNINYRTNADLGFNASMNYTKIYLHLVGFRLGMQYDNRNTKLSVPAYDWDEKKFTTNMLSFKAQLALRPINMLSVYSGLEYNVLLSAKQGDNDVTDELNRSNVSADIGAEVFLIPLIGVFAEYAVGLNNISKNATYNIYTSMLKFGVVVRL